MNFLYIYSSVQISQNTGRFHVSLLVALLFSFILPKQLVLIISTSSVVVILTLLVHTFTELLIIRVTCFHGN